MVAGFDGGNITSKAGALLPGQVDQGVGLVPLCCLNRSSVCCASMRLGRRRWRYRRKHGISEPTFYIRKAKSGGMIVPDTRRLKQLEEENARLKKLLAEERWTMRKDITTRKW